MSPRIFNLIVDAVVREWLRIDLGAEQSLSGIRKKIRRLIAVVYVDDGLVALRDLIHLQQEMTTLVSLFERVGLKYRQHQEDGGNELHCR